MQDLMAAKEKIYSIIFMHHIKASSCWASHIMRVSLAAGLHSILSEYEAPGSGSTGRLAGLCHHVCKGAARLLHSHRPFQPFALLAVVLIWCVTPLQHKPATTTLLRHQA